MSQVDIEAIYEHGTLKLPQELPLPDGQKVTITIHGTSPNVPRRRGLIEWKGSIEDLDYLIMNDDNSTLEASYDADAYRR
ncbi:MAG: antitoxin family protein [Planctomycetes bacterium]|nr:antitoxin family protein [Planctomycetota bacterium]